MLNNIFDYEYTVILFLIIVPLFQNFRFSHTFYKEYKTKWLYYFITITNINY